MAYKVHKVPAM